MKGMKGIKQVIGDPKHAQEAFTNPTLPFAMPVCATPAVPVRAGESTGVVDGLEPVVLRSTLSRADTDTSNPQESAVRTCAGLQDLQRVAAQ